MKYFIISGSPVYGFRYIGPFEAEQEAVNYQLRNKNTLYKDWWIAELLAPSENASTFN